MGYDKQIISRFEDKIIILEDTCWAWGASHSSTGYGSFRIAGKTYNAHRLSYEIYRGDIKPGLQLDHTCRNRSCVNPNHLEPVSHGENIRRGSATKNICQHGVGVTRCNDGCKRAYQREWQQKKRGYKQREINK
jgi:hypothetical protein